MSARVLALALRDGGALLLAGLLAYAWPGLALAVLFGACALEAVAARLRT